MRALERRRRAIEDALRANGIEADLYQSDSEDDTARRIDAALGAGVRTIVAAGGDGTVRSVAFELIGRDVALGILPLGTAMNVARSLDIPLDLEAAAAVLAAGATRADRCRRGARPAVPRGGVDRAWRRGPRRRNPRRGGSSPASLRLAPARCQISEDQGPAAARRPRGARARADDRRGERPVHRPRHRARARGEARRWPVRRPALRGLRPAPAGRGISCACCSAGRATRRIRRYRAATVRISSHRPLAVRLDSQDVGTTPVQLVTRPGALRVIAPPPAATAPTLRRRASRPGRPP